MFIALEGGEGAGKSTQERLLAEHLHAIGREVVRTREPGGTPAGEDIRAVVLNPEHAGLDIRAEALLFAAARAEHAAKVIRPALARGAVVVTDRYIDSSVCYQGIARGLGIEAIEEISMWATQGLLPDLTILLDVDPKQGLGRAKDPNRLEAEPIEFHQAVREGFLELAQRDANRYVVIDANQSVEEIAAQIAQAVDAKLAARA